MREKKAREGARTRAKDAGLQLMVQLTGIRLCEGDLVALLVASQATADWFARLAAATWGQCAENNPVPRMQTDRTDMTCWVHVYFFYLSLSLCVCIT